jgi:hypothetical protein
MELSASWEAASCAVTQELPSILWNPKVHYRAHKGHPLVPVLNQTHPVHTTPFYLSKIRFNIVHPPMSWSSQWSFSFWLSHQHPNLHCSSPHSCYIPCPSHPPWLDYCNYIWRRETINWTWILLVTGNEVMVVFVVTMKCRFHYFKLLLWRLCIRQGVGRMN